VKRSLHKIPAIRAFITILLVTGALLVQAQNLPSREYQLKAVFLFNFTQFVDWPPAAFPNEQAPMIIGVIGDNPFGSYLQETVSGEKVNGHPVVVENYKNAGEIRSCHILFINLDEPRKREELVEALKGRNILTVGDAPDFSREGGMIRFFKRDNKIKLQINPDASKAASLVLSSKLLRLADIFTPKENN
jgi:hypothetical protein